MTNPIAPPNDDSAVTVMVAKRFHTLDAGFPVVDAVAIRGGRVICVGSLDQVTTALGAIPFSIDRTLAENVVVPGLIDQHLHPLLGATTLAMEVIATENWVLPEHIYQAAMSQDEYRQRLAAADHELADPAEWLLTWGYHAMWHGPLDRHALDTISATRPIGVWHRSCHEFYMNSAAIDLLGITAESLVGHGPSSEQVDVEAGHFWEAGFMNLVLPSIAPVLISRERVERGLHQMVAYLRQNGVTAFNEPGVFWEVEPWDLYTQILGADDTPFLSTFMVDGRGQSAKGIHGDDAIADAHAQVARAPEGKVAMLDGHVKLFADGAIISQLMQMRDGYLGADGQPDPDHRGEWLMTPDEYQRAFTTYWDAGWQIHTHVNGDLGLDLVLDTLESCLLRKPRADHRTTVVHFANSTDEQVARIARLGAIISANPYYPCGFADKYREVGLGPQRADSMVRAQSAIRHHIPLSLHSDLPMAPAEPLKLASFAVNRTTPSGRVAGADQRISVLDALRGVTIEAAYSWRREHDLGTITPGKLATFTVLADDPFEVDPSDLGRIRVVGVVYEGCWSPVPSAPADRPSASLLVRVPGHASGGHVDGHDHDGHSCSCQVARLLSESFNERYGRNGGDRTAA